MLISFVDDVIIRLECMWSNSLKSLGQQLTREIIDNKYFSEIFSFESISFNHGYLTALLLLELLANNEFIVE